MAAVEEGEVTYWSKAFAPEYLSNWVLAFIGLVGIVFAILTLWLLMRQTRATEVAAQAANLNAQAVIITPPDGDAQPHSFLFLRHTGSTEQFEQVRVPYPYLNCGEFSSIL